MFILGAIVLPSRSVFHQHLQVRAFSAAEASQYPLASLTVCLGVSLISSGPLPMFAIALIGIDA
jgi:hypothetical protein